MNRMCTVRQSCEFLPLIPSHFIIWQAVRSFLWNLFSRGNFCYVSKVITAFYKTVIQMKGGIGRCACDVLRLY